MANWPGTQRDYWSRFTGAKAGELKPCVCSEKRQAGLWHDFILANCGLPMLSVERWTFENYLLDLNPGCTKALHSTKAWVQGKGSPWLFISGPYGLGKTHLLTAAVGYLLEAGVQVRYWAAHDLYLHLVEIAKGDNYAEEVRALEQVAALVLDDLGTERRTDFATDLFHSVLDSRYSEQKPTLISSNEPPSRFAGRLRSRFSDDLVVTTTILQGKDMRKEARP